MTCKWCDRGDTYHTPSRCVTPCADGASHTVKVKNSIGYWIMWECESCKMVWQDDSSG